MSELSMLDLPYYLKQIGGIANGVKLIGVLAGEIEQPEHLMPLTLKEKNDRFAVLDIVGMLTATGKYYSKGKVLCVLNKSVIESSKNKDSGRIAIALVGGSVRLVDQKRGHVSNFVQMMKWSKGEYNSWQVGHIDAIRFKKEDFPEFFNVVVNAYKNNWNFTYPIPVPDGYTEACQDYDFRFVDTIGEQQDTSTPVNVFRQPPIEKPVSPVALSGLDLSKIGVSDSSNIATLVGNRTLTDDTIKSKVKLIVENRDNIIPRSKNAKKMEEFITESDAKVAKIIAELAEISSDDSTIEDSIRYTAEQLKASWTTRVGFTTGRNLFKEALERALPDYDVKGNNGGTVITDTLNVINTALVDNWVDFDAEEFPDNKFIMSVNTNRNKIYFKMLELLLGIRDKLSWVYDLADNQGIDMLTTMRQNPYNLCFIDPRLNVEDLDKLAMMHGVDMKDEAVKRVRNVAYMHNYMLDSTNAVVAENTTVKYSDLIRSVRAGFILGKRDYDNLQLEGVVIPSEKIFALQYFIAKDTDLENFKLPREGWIKGFNKYILSNNQIADSMIKDYLDCGLGVSIQLDGTHWVSDFIFAKKEMYIYNRLHELCENGKEIELSEANIKKCVTDFEILKAKEFGLSEGAFKLEQRQSEAVGLLRNPVICLTGPAGSGKTTTAEVLVYGAETLLGIEPEDIMFCAPTGKAANRLKEIVKRKTRTINSLFGVGGEGLTIKDPDDVVKKDDIKVLIVDESSMPNINLMYDMLLRISDDTRIFFLGDREQLPPIGFGKPFATFLTFLPTVVLNVTKRASDKSGITRNAKKIIYESDGVIKDLEDYPDYRIINEKDQNKVIESVSSIVRYHLGLSSQNNFVPVENLGQDLAPDDIQVISPVNKNIWGTMALNKMLQEIFNKKKPSENSVLYSVSQNDKTEFRIGDRVIHTKKNYAERTRLTKVGETSFVYERSKGIMNGEVGKIIGFYNAKELDFSQEKDGGKKLAEEFGGNENTYFMGVAFKDIDEDTGDSMEFIIFYRMDMINKSGSYIDVTSGDLQNLDLAYALTVHKLQGSQAKLTIVTILPVGKGIFASNFLSRNMIYTANTRAQQANYLIGDIYGRDSCINKGRKVEQTSKRASNIDNF